MLEAKNMQDEMLTKNAQDEMVLVNIVEELVREKVDELIKDLDMCKCQNCKLNACAIALNNLPPHYVTTERGALLAELVATEVNRQTTLTVEVMKALLTVREQPLH